MRIDGAQQLHFAIFLGHQRLLHGGEFDVEVEFRQVEVGREGFRDVAVFVPLQRKAARLIFPLDAVEIQQIREHFFAGMAEAGAGDARTAGGDDAAFGKFEARFELDFVGGVGRKQPLLAKALGGGGGEHLGGLRGVRAGEVEREIEGGGIGRGAAEACFAHTLLFGVEFAKARESVRFFEPQIQHEIAGAVRVDGGDTRAQQPRRGTKQMFGAVEGDHQRMLAGQARQHRDGGRGPGARGNRSVAEFLGHPLGQARFRDQLEVQELCGSARYFFPARRRIARNRKQCHPLHCQNISPMETQNIFVRQATLADLDLIVPLFDAYRQFYQQTPDLALARSFCASGWSGISL